MASFFSRLKQGLNRSSQKINAALTHRTLDDAALNALEDALIGADLGPTVAARVIQDFRRTRFGKDVSTEEIHRVLSQEIARVLAPVARPFTPDVAHKPHVVLVVGVNGVGKTTTIGKMAQWFAQKSLTSMLVAGDTFRAAATEQLEIWGQRVGSRVISGKQGADAAGLAFDGIQKAREDDCDLVFIDTAGRLHNKGALMDELTKIIRVMRKIDETAPHSVLLVLDATTGQNALEQVRVFKELVNVSGLVVTKLDGSARGGVVIALAENFGLPVHFVGVGEQAEDLQPFSALQFAEGLVAGQIKDEPDQSAGLSGPG